MAAEQFLKIVAVKDIEPLKTWEDVCDDPNKLFEEFARRFVVDPGVINTLSIIKSPSVPEPENRSMVWIKTSFPYGIGVLIDGYYKMDYGLSQFPVDSPFLHLTIETLPGPQIRLLTGDELTAYGLVDTNVPPDPTKRMRWYMFEPEPIEV